MVIYINAETTLKQLEEKDAADIFRLIDSQRHYLGQWLPFVELTTVLSDTETFVNGIINAPEGSSEYVFTIRRQNKCIGLIGFKDTDRANKKTEIGYWLSAHFQKQGIVTQSVELLCGMAFDQLGMNRVQIKCAVDNLPSKNIPRRLGFTFEGIERAGELLSGNVYTDLEVYSRLKGDKVPENTV